MSICRQLAARQLGRMAPTTISTVRPALPLASAAPVAQVRMRGTKAGGGGRGGGGGGGDSKWDRRNGGGGRGGQRGGQRAKTGTYTDVDSAKAYVKTLRKPPTRLSPDKLPKLIANRLEEWGTSKRLTERLAAFGFGEADNVNGCIQAWTSQVTEDFDMLPVTASDADGGIYGAMDKLGWDSEELRLAYEDGHGFAEVFERAMLRHFLTYASTHGPQRLQLHLKSLLQVTDCSGVAQYYSAARTQNRQFHLHMGPTNSGKTYTALKALSKAETGVYAGPLRLLAHEVWERLNLGTVGDLNGVGRACNLLTGEERRIVDNASLVSCTVEMVPVMGSGGAPWDVVVIDEIQMLGEPDRGGAWTTAVMGVNAKEVHLCGDETTAQLLESMISSFKGDTLTVHRYERLTPLTVADKSLESDWQQVRPGDCVVTFSRNAVYGVKKKIEGAVNKKCAVVYGALPPETRAEQARDFNNDTGKTDILVASDAVGMGLNLKIGRIIFETMSKWNGVKEAPLALTQVKQIAGRAGRFGMARKVDDGTSTADDGSSAEDVPASGGVVTTMHAADLPILRAMLPLPLPPITRASFDPPSHAISGLAPLLDPTTTYGDLITHFDSLAKLPRYTKMRNLRQKLPLADVVQQQRNILTLDEMSVLTKAPVNNRDPLVAEAYANIVDAYARDYVVSIDDILDPTGLLETLESIEMTLEPSQSVPDSVPGPSHSKKFGRSITITGIPALESLHKALVMYIWLSFRLELSFPERIRAMEYKARAEAALEQCLERLPGVRMSKGSVARQIQQRVWDEQAKEDESKAINWKTIQQQKDELLSSRFRHVATEVPT